MLIECLLKRAEPIVVPIGNEKYEFELDDAGRNVVEVWLADHIKAFLAVAHLYREAAPTEAPATPRAATKPTSVSPAGHTISQSRTEMREALKARGIPFLVTMSNEKLRELLAGGQEAA